MNTWDLCLLGGLLLPGLFLLAHGISAAITSADGTPIRERFTRLHITWRDRMIESGAFPFPGVRLVTSWRPFIAGEAVFSGSLALSLAYAPSFFSMVSFTLLALATGFLATFLSFRDQARRQIIALRSSLPVASFLLSLLLEAGIGSHVALQEVSIALPAGPLSKELNEISGSRMLGLPRKEALDRSRKRIPLDDYHTLLNLIQQGEELGVGLSQALREHSGKLLEKQHQRAEAFAQKAAIRILLPLVLFIFPAVFLVILSPVVLSLWEMWQR
jgi:tight adherence protein C